jgi:hypothetical protein
MVAQPCWAYIIWHELHWILAAFYEVQVVNRWCSLLHLCVLLGSVVDSVHVCSECTVEGAAHQAAVTQ